MNWRRGLLLAGMNLIAAIPMIFTLNARDAQFLRDRGQQSGLEKLPRIENRTIHVGTPAKIVRVQEEQTVSFSPCGMWAHYPAQSYVVQFGNLPAFIVSQWRVVCPPKWSVAKMLGVDDSGLLSNANFKAMRRVDVALCVLIASQWFSIGSFPLIQARRWWAEPGAFITACTAIASGIALIPMLDDLSRFPALIAFLAWLWWFSLLVWIPIRKTFQSTLHGLQRLTH